MHHKWPLPSAVVEWPEIAKSLQGRPFEDHWAAYQQLPAYSPAWYPRGESNLSEFAKAHDIEGYEALHKWSVEHPAAFWKAAISRIHIPFHEIPEVVLGDDPLDPRWLFGAKLNAADGCFHGEKAAILCGDEQGNRRTVTYGQLRAEANRVSNGLAKIGLTQGDAVALYMPMTPECVAAYLGIVQAGLAVVSIPDSFAPDEVATRLKLGNAKAVVTVASFQRAGKAVPMYPKAVEAGAAKCIVIGAAELRPEDFAWADFLGTDDFKSVPCDPYDVTNILFSSGTTGEPKAIPWTHCTPIKAAVDGHFHQDIHSGDVVAWPTNIGWMMGPWLIYATFMNGATMSLFEGAPTGKPFFDFLRETKTTVLGLVPSIVRAWMKSGVTAPGDLPDVRIFSSTGEASNAHDYLYLMSLANYNAPIIEYCGGTEIGGGHLTGSVMQPQIPAAFSTPALGLAFVLLDEDGAEIQPGEMGEIFLKPPSMGLSERLLNRDHNKVYYTDLPDHKDQLRKHGDQVHWVREGVWAAAGRADDTMNLGGIKVSSVELETVMNGHPDVTETAAVAIRPKSGGADQLIVFAVATGGVELKAELQARIKAKLNPLFRIHDLVIVDSLPRTASNKVMRKDLRAAYE